MESLRICMMHCRRSTSSASSGWRVLWFSSKATIGGTKAWNTSGIDMVQVDGNESKFKSIRKTSVAVRRVPDHRSSASGLAAASIVNDRLIFASLLDTHLPLLEVNCAS